MTSTPTGDANLTNDTIGLESDDEIANAFLTANPEEGEDAPSKKKKPSENGENDKDEGDEPSHESDDTETTDEDETADDDQEGDAEGDEDGDGEDDKTKDEKKYADSDDIYVKVKVGDEEHEVPVKDLKRLFGQEAALTRKSQTVADKERVADAATAKNIAALDVMIKRATSRADQYRQLPWAQLYKDPNVAPEQIEALQKEATAAIEDETFLKSNLDGYMKDVEKKQSEERVATARECVKQLNDSESKFHIKGWNDAVYNDLRKFGIEEMGLNAGMVNNLTDPGAFKIMHLAMQFVRGQTKVKTQVVNKTPKKIVKNKVSSPPSKGTSKTVDKAKALGALKKTGSQADAENAFLAMFADD